MRLDNSSKMYDVLVIGAGIHGAGIAQACAAHGYSTVVLEQNEIASGTSSKSSKLIHGGLRYLESAQFSLVKECLQEREYLLKNAAHLVELKPFLIPVYKQTQRRPWKIRLGLSLYAALNQFRASGRFKSIKKNVWSKLDGLSLTNLQNVFQYYDAQTDDRLLTKAVIESAKSLGVLVIKPAKFLGAIRENDNWSIRYAYGGVTQVVKTKVVVNASGPWVNHVLAQLSNPSAIKKVDLVQGTHIVLSGETAQGIYYLESPIDQRAIFVMPWYGDTMIGTTEKLYQGDPEKVEASDSEVSYLLESVQAYFPKFQSLGIDQVKTKFAGLRVLPRAEGTAFSRPRETTIFEDKNQAPGFFSIYGGKLTAYRATAEEVQKKIAHLLPNKKPIADTKTLKLPMVTSE